MLRRRNLALKINISAVKFNFSARDKNNMLENQPNNTKRKIISIISTVIGLIIIALLIIGGSLLSSKRWDPSWNPFRNTKGEQVSQM